MLNFNQYLTEIAKLPSYEKQRMRQIHGYLDHLDLTDDIAKKYGIEKIGKGVSASVYDSTRNYVVKVFNLDDTGAKQWLKFCAEHQNNPYVPKLRGKMIRLNNYLYAVRMEKLKHVKDIGKVSWTADFVWRIQQILREQSEEQIRSKYSGNILEVLLFLKQKRHVHVLDLSLNNVMFRGNQPVFTDPLIHSL